MTPQRVYFKRVLSKGPPQHEKVVITRGDGGPLKLKLTPVKVQGVEASLREIEPGERYELDVSVIPPFQSDRVRGNLTLETGIAEAPTVTIPVIAKLAPHVVAEPRRFSVPKNRKTVWEQSVRLVWDDEAPHRILSATANDPALMVRVTEKDGRQEVVLQVPPEYLSERLGRRVTIKTDDTKSPAVKVPIVFLFGKDGRPRKKGSTPAAVKDSRPRTKGSTPLPTSK